jgi:hypothetical protein
MRPLVRSTILSLAAMLIGYAAYAATDWFVQGTVLQDLSSLCDVAAVFGALTLTEQLFEAAQTRFTGAGGGGHAGNPQ